MANTAPSGTLPNTAILRQNQTLRPSRPPEYTSIQHWGVGGWGSGDRRVQACFPLGTVSLPHSIPRVSHSTWQRVDCGWTWSARGERTQRMHSPTPMPDCLDWHPLPTTSVDQNPSHNSQDLLSHSPVADTKGTHSSQVTSLGRHKPTRWGPITNQHVTGEASKT